MSNLHNVNYFEKSINRHLIKVNLASSENILLLKIFNYEVYLSFF